MLGHLQVKCRGLNGERYDDRTAKSFEDWLERIAEFRRAIADREDSKEDRQAENQANKLGEAVRRILENVGPRDQNALNPTTQLVKSRWPPVWIGQKFDKWRLEINKWKENNKSTEEDKYVDLLESLKKKMTPLRSS